MSLEYIRKLVLSWAADIRLYTGGIVLFGYSYYKIRGKHEREIMDRIQPGDIFLRRYDHYLGSRFISFISGTYWSHAAVYVGDYNDEPGRVIHLLSGGATNEDILTFMRCDDLTVLRCREVDYIPKAIAKAKHHYERGTKYDYIFSPNNDALYCSEFVKDCYDGVEFYNRVSEKIIYPSDFLNSIFDVIWERK